MLSYMLPMEDKPPPGPKAVNKGHMQLSLGDGETLTNGHHTNHHHHHPHHHQQQQQQQHRPSSPLSKETSVSSFISDVTTTASHSSMTPTSSSDKGKPKLIINGGKHQTLKRVSFGSSKGSMVETLIFESPVQEEPEPSPIPETVDQPLLENQDQSEIEREKVRVTFFQQSKPQEVDLPDAPVVFDDSDFMMATAVTMNNDANHLVYNRMESTESGWENPFRPGGDLSREADEIVEMIKGGKPITPTLGNAQLPYDENDTTVQLIGNNNGGGIGGEPITQSPKKSTTLNTTPKSANGNVKNDTKQPLQQQQQQQQQTGAIDVKRGTVKPDGDGTQIEHVTIKKKSKCKCCVIQ